MIEVGTEAERGKMDQRAEEKKREIKDISAQRILFLGHESAVYGDLFSRSRLNSTVRPTEREMTQSPQRERETIIPCIRYRHVM